MNSYLLKLFFLSCYICLIIAPCAEEASELHNCGNERILLETGSGVQKPVLPYDQNALEPEISAETMSYHFGKHHMGYYNKLISALDGHALKNKDLEFIVKNSEGKMFNLAA